MKTLRKIDSYLQGHPDEAYTRGGYVFRFIRTGISTATGMALSASLMEGNTEYIQYLEMEKFRKDRFGKRQCLQDIES